MLSPFYVFPRLRNRNLSHIPVRRENLLQQTGGFRTFSHRPAPPRIPFYIGLSGMMTAAMIYASIPPPVHPNSTKSSRIRVGSILKYSPMPPHTPQSIL